MRKVLFIQVTLLIFIWDLNAQKSITKRDTEVLVGNWTGSLTYIDYSSGEPYTMPANLIVEKGKKDKHFNLQNIYPNEPKANNKSKFKISADGTEINNEKIVSIDRKPEGGSVITTEYMGKDNNKKALIRTVYTISQKQLIFRKLVKYEDSEEWIMRNEFSYRRAI